MTGAHLYISQLKYGGFGQFIGSPPATFLQELGTIMSKHNVIHLEAIVVPCGKEVTITFQPEGDPDKESPDQDVT